LKSLPGISGQEFKGWYEEAKAAAIAAEIPLAELDWLVQASSNLDRLALRLGTGAMRSRIELQIPFPQLAQLWQKRLQDRVPVQYLAGKTTWRHFQLKVTPDVLIPRPETECIIDRAIAAVEGGDWGYGGELSTQVNVSPIQQVDCTWRGGPHVPQFWGNLAVPRTQNLKSKIQNWADLGTGSGAIAIALAEAFPAATIHAVDSSANALEIARENARNLGFDKNIKFYQGAWWEPLADLKGQIGGMVSNPPYIPTAMLAQLQPEVARHEPRLALDGGPDGLDCLRYLVETAPNYLRPGGIWLVEMMAGQAEAVAELLRQQGSYRDLQLFSDLAGIDRFALAYRC
jgi:release factor glutamine methyltransferase